MVGASCSQWIACSPMRNGGGGRPLNSVVRSHLSEKMLTKVAIFGAGLTILGCAASAPKESSVIPDNPGKPKRIEFARYLVAGEIDLPPSLVRD
jgi:hypothetical protein